MPTADSHPDRSQAVAAFWAWWPQARDRCVAAIRGGSWPDDLIAEINERVNAIDPKLQWEFGNGSAANHVLVVSPGGDPALRGIASDWLGAAPAADATFEYAASRQPEPDAVRLTLTVNGTEIAVAALRYAITVTADRVDLLVYHPAFAALSEETRWQAAFLTLDWLLGEDAVDSRIGFIDVVTETPQLAQRPEQLREQVRHLVQRYPRPL
jgi:hypothetical protein